ncbi:MAG: cell division protein ZapA [Gammaproteobacteria bacterium]
MSEESRPVTVSILDKDYIVGCKDHEHEFLYSAVDLLKHKLEALRVTGKLVGNERLAVMAALNIAHELLEHRRREDAYHERIDAFMRRVDTKLAGISHRGEEAPA